MKLKPNREKKTVIDVFKDIYSNENEAAQTAISIDINGCINIDSFKRLIDYRQDSIVIETRQKRVYIYGEDLTILSCNRHSAVCNGKIRKIELFENEV